MQQTTPSQIKAQQRLTALPPKTAQPLLQLLRLGQIAEDGLNIVLDAAEQAQDTNKVLGFMAGYLHMRSQGVPVHDVIAMAKNQNRRVNLAWTPSRWKDEHQRLSRAEALSRLAQENVRYDISAYETHLPAKFPGYLIKTSRRLGMEGLRQRHCIASYHERLAMGSCAIASVFVAKQRWTVQLELTQEADTPLRITQIKTRYNALPPADVRRAIHDALAIELPKPADHAPARAQDGDPLYLQNLRLLLPTLRARAFQLVTVVFDGSGDSGSIQYIDFDHAGEVPGDLPTEHLATQQFFDEGTWNTNVTLKQSTLREALEALTYDYLEETGIDWYNNDGGFGDLVIDVNNGTVTLDINTRYTESTTAHSSERDIATGANL